MTTVAANATGISASAETRQPNRPASGAAPIASERRDRARCRPHTTVTAIKPRPHSAAPPRCVAADAARLAVAGSAYPRRRIASSMTTVATMVRTVVNDRSGTRLVAARVSRIVSTERGALRRVHRYVHAMPDVILPVLDEADAIPDVLAGLPVGFDPIVVDNGSTDGSGDIARVASARRSSRAATAVRCRVLRRTARRDRRRRVLHGLRRLFRRRRLVAVAAPVLAGDADLVMGARRARKARGRLHAARRESGSSPGSCGAARGIHLHDLGPMRAVRRLDLLIDSASRIAASAGRSRWSCAPRSPAGASARSTCGTHPGSASRR